MWAIWNITINGHALQIYEYSFAAALRRLRALAVLGRTSYAVDEHGVVLSVEA
jgi:hypothetical protein